MGILKALIKSILEDKAYYIGAGLTYGTWVVVNEVVKPKKGIVAINSKRVGVGPYDIRNSGVEGGLANEHK